MDIFIHSTSGMLMGATVMSINPWRLTNTPLQIGKAIVCGGLAGAFPDLDAVSQWSGFDQTFGAWFGLASGDEVYSGKWWYSHHAFTHSLLASLLYAAIILLMVKASRRDKENVSAHGWHAALVALVGYNAHLVGDLPTPKGAWDGIAYWWPSIQYVGGTGHTFWWNNYDLFIIIVCTLFLQIIWLLWIRFKNRVFGTCSTILAFAAIIYQLNDRPMNFNDRSLPYTERERISLEYQEKILGSQLYEAMRYMDRHLPFYF
jgi:inner membrane protein